MNSNISSILYASDLGEGSNPAFSHAISMAQKNNANVTYLHVIEPIPETSRGLIESYMGEAEFEKQQKESFQQVMDTAKQRVKDFCETEINKDLGKFNIDVVIKKGKSWRCILDSADVIDADMIIMGARKHGAVEKLLLGTTSNKVVQHSSRPVLIVPLTSKD